MTITERPLVTFALFAYNQELYVAEAVEGALAQDYDNLEIIISDDCSTDRTFEIIKQVAADYDGIHNVRVMQNAKNLGLSGHFNKIISEAQGEIIVVAAGDDISLPNRSSSVVQILNDNPSVMAVSFDDHVIDKEGKVIRFNKSTCLGENNIISSADFFRDKFKKPSGASRGFRKELYTRFGDLNEECPTEDTPYLLRTFLIGSAYSSNLPGIYYRRHGSNLSNDKSLNSMNFQAIFDQYSRDIKLAKEANFSKSEILEMAYLWAEKNFRRRIVLGKVFNRKLSWRAYMNNVLCSSDYNLKEKTRILIRLLFTNQ